ncbi:zinc finger and BTB domain-containing protein 5 [Grus japonensis]|uniref:Zinc finger and BTB domain-containing protein 5 n=1 Tax=Grus japonensis TaxID=30415 RepID=A0ABC9WAS3_GRUJA
MVRQAVPLQPMEVHGGADIHLQPMEDDGGADIHLQPVEDPTPEQVDVPKGGCDPVGSPHWSKLLAGPVTLWREEPTLEQVCWQDLWPRGGPMLEQSAPEGLHPMEGTHTGAVHEELQPMGRTDVGEVHGGLSPVEGPHAGAGAECEESSP